MTEFKQIVGRGTRVHEDTKKYYFTLIDFRKATNHFADPDFDGEPVQIYEPGDGDPISPPDDVPPTVDGEDPIPPVPGDDEVIVDGKPWPTDISLPPGDSNEHPPKYYIYGHEVRILTERIEYLDENGKLVTESLRDYSKRTLRKHFASLDAFLGRWNTAERKEAVIEELENEGLLLEPLADEQGIADLDDPQILKISPFDAMGTPLQLLKSFGGRDGFEKVVHELQSALYQEVA